MDHDRWVRRVRGAMSEERVTLRKVCEVSHLNYHHASGIMAGSNKRPGELFRARLRRGLRQLGIDAPVPQGPEDREETQ